MNIPERIGRYHLGAKLGAGASGAVFRAEDTLIGRTVALKLIRIEDAAPGGSTNTELATVEHFQREAQAAGRLHHSGIVTLYDAGQEGEYCYLAMEFIDGETLTEALAREGFFPTEKALRMGADVADALDFAHEQGVVHRDIKPSNLMLLPGGTVKVADFGIARLTSAAVSVATAAPTGMMIGTPSYMSPEQVRAEPVDGRSDIFSLGVVLYQATTGEKPFGAENMGATLNAIMNVDPPPAHERNPVVSPEVSRVLERAMAKDRESRYPSGAQLAADLRILLDDAAGGTMIARSPADNDLTQTVLQQPQSARSESTADAAPDVQEPAAPMAEKHRGNKALVFGGSLAGLAVAGALGAYSLGLFPAGAAPSYVVSTSEPAGADIVLDGKVVGRTPYTFEIAPGSYDIEYRKPGYFPTQATIQVKEAERVPVEVELIPEELE